MFATISCCITPHHSHGKEAPQSPSVLKNTQLLGMIADAAFAAILIATGVCILLAASGVNIGALNALSTMGTMAAWILIGVAGGVVIGNFIGLALISIKSAKQQYILYRELREEVNSNSRHVRFMIPTDHLSESAQTEIRNKDEIIAGLHQEIEQLRCYPSDPAASSSEMTARLQQLEEERSSAQAELENLRSSNEESIASSSSLKTRVRELEQECNALSTSQRELEASTARLNQQKKGLETRIHELQTQLESKVAIDDESHASKQRELQARQAELAAINRQIPQKQTELATIAQQISEKQTELETVNFQIPEKQAELAAINRQISEKQVELEDIVEQISASSDEMNESQTELVSLEETLTAVMSEISQQESKRDELAEEIVKLNKELGETEKLKEFASVFERMDPASAQSTSGIMRRSRPPSGESDSTPIDTAQLRGELSGIVTEARQPSKKQLKKGIKEKTQELNGLNTAIPEKRRELDEIKESLKRGRESISEMELELTILQESIAAKTEEKTQIESQLVSTRRELEEARRELSNLAPSDDMPEFDDVEGLDQVFSERFGASPLPPPILDET